MKKIIFVVILSLCWGTAAWASGPVETFAKGCQQELETYCQDVEPGDGRLLACLYAHEDKVSGQCQYAIFQAASQLEQAFAALQHIANQCADDILNNCGDVEIGDDRVINCMKENEDKVSASCVQAFKDTGLWE